MMVDDCGSPPRLIIFHDQEKTTSIFAVGSICRTAGTKMLFFCRGKPLLKTKHESFLSKLMFHLQRSNDGATNQVKISFIIISKSKGGGIKTKTGFLTLFSFPLRLKVFRHSSPHTDGMVMSNSSSSSRRWSGPHGVQPWAGHEMMPFLKIIDFFVYFILFLFLNPTDVFCLSGMYRQ